MLTPRQREEFETLGFVRLPGAFAADAAPMQDVVWQELERLHGIRRADPSTWRPDRPSGLQGIKAAPEFAPIGGAVTAAAIDDLLGSGAWPPPKQGGLFLVSFPGAGTRWTVPSTGWHVDSDLTFALEPLFGLRIYTFLSDVVAEGGGTVVLSGSHRLVARRVRGRPAEELADFRRERRELFRSDPWLHELTREGGGDRDRFLAEHVIEGVPVRVVPLTGAAGDVVLAHPWLFHARAPHTAPEPKLMRSKDIYRRVLPEGSRVFGRAVRSA